MKFAFARWNSLLPGLVVIAIGSVIAFNTALLVWSTHSSMIHGDGFGFLRVYADYVDGRMNALEYFWRQHTEHRHGLARLLFLLDAQLAGGTQVLEKSVTAALFILLAALFVTVAASMAWIPLPVRLVVIGLLLIVFGSNRKMEVLFQGFTNVFATYVFSTVLALYLTARSIATREPARAWGLFAAACVLAFASAYSYAPGLLVGYAMAAQYAAFRQFRRTAASLAAATAIAFTYLWDFRAGSGDIRVLFQEPFSVAQYVFAYIGSPVAGGDLHLAIAAGMVLVTAAVYASIRYRNFAPADRPMVSFLLALCVITVAAGAATSLGRLQLGVAFATSSRYVALAEVMLAAVLLLGLLRWQPRQDQAPGWIRRPRAGLFALIVAACVPIIFGQKYWTEAAPGYRDRWERAAAAVIAKAPDVEAWQGLAAIGPMEFRWIDYLAEHRLSVFHSDADLHLYRSIRNDWKKPLSELRPTNGAWCKGSVDPGTGVPGQVPQWFLLGGYAFDAEEHVAVDGVLFTEPDGRLIGIARPISERPDIEAIAGLKHHGLKLHYIGYAQVDAGPVQAYAFRAKRPTLCKIG